MLLVIHGLGDRALAWTRFAVALGPGVEVRTFDLPGHGEAPAATDYGYPALVEAVGRVAAELDRFSLLGHSVGAAVAWLYAARHPERVSRLVLVEPAAPHQSPFLHGPTPEPRHPYSYASVVKIVEMLKSINPAVTEADVREGYRRRPDGRWEPDFDPAFYPVLIEEARTNGAAYREELGRIRAPTLVVRGDRSFLRREQVEEIADSISGARLVTLAGAHFLHRERTEQLARAVAEFLAEEPRS